MLSPVFAAIFMALAYYFSPSILKSRKVLYVAVFGLLAIEVVLRNAPFMVPFVKGYVGYALFFVVAISGALPSKWTLTKRLMSVRGAYSIFGFVILTAHPIFYASEILSGIREIPWYGLISYVSMIPLYITSYMKVRVKMKAKDWKNLQRFAYLSYAFMFTHLIVNASSTPNRVVAIVMASIYVILKAYHSYVYFKQLKPSASS